MKKKLKMSLVINITIFLLTVFSTIVMMAGIRFMHGVEPVLEVTKLGVFKFFTVDSNILVGLIALLFALEEIKLLKGTKKEISNKLYILKLLSTTAVSITFIVVFTYLGAIVEGGIPAMLQNSNMFFHLVIPVLSIITFVLFEKDNKLKMKDTIYGIFPTVIYGLFYLTNIIIHMKNGKVSPQYDWYWFVQNGVWTAIIVMPFMLLVSYIISLILFKLNKKVIK
jgi:hypothetical protein